MTESVRIEGAADTPIAWVRDADTWVLVHGRRNPVRDADALLNHLPGPLPDALVVVGLGLGYLIDALIARRWSGRLLALEPEPALSAALLARPVCAEWHAAGRLRVITAPDFAHAAEALAEFGVVDPQPVIHPVLARTHADMIRRATAILTRAAAGVRANAQARSRQAALCLRNTLTNLRQLAGEGDVTALAGLTRDLPAVVVAAGPSLDRQLADLRQLQSSALIIAVDTALRPLLTAGIRPHLVVAVDPSTINGTHLTDLSHAESTWLVAEASIDPNAVAAFHGRVFAFRVGCRHPWPWLIAEGCDTGTLRAWGSVLTTAFDLAVSMGANPIAFAGADLAFTGSRPYCRGTTFEELWRRAGDGGSTLASIWAANLATWPRVDEPGVGGDVCLTAPHLVSFRDWISQQATDLATHRIVNTTGAGILVGPAIEQRPLGELLAGSSRFDPRPRLMTAWRRGSGLRSLPAVVERLTAEEPGAVRARASWEQATGIALDASTLSTLLAGVTRDDETCDGGPPDKWPRADSPAPPASADETRMQEIRESLPAHSALITVELTGDETSAEAVVLEALRMAGEAGAVALLDRSPLPLGEWGRQVGRALVRVDPTLSAEFPWYLDWRRRATIVQRGLPVSPERVPADAWKHGAANRAAAHDMAEILTRRFVPASVVDIGPGDGAWLDSFRERGVADVRGVPIAEAAAGGDTPAPRADLCLCIGVADRLNAVGAANVIARCVATSDVVVFAAMDPGRGRADVPLARTLGWWAAHFWRAGYVLSDELRPAIEAKWPLVRGLHDFLVCFRRVVTRAEADDLARYVSLEQAVAALADRIDVLRTRVTAEQIECQRLAQAVRRPIEPAVPAVRMRMPPARLHPEPEGVFLFRFRTRAARRWLARDDAGPPVMEGEVPLVRCAHGDELSERGAGHYAIAGDEIRLRPLSGADPRLAGPGLFVVLPEDIAGTELLPLDLIVRSGL